MDFTIPEDLKMLQTLARDFVKDQLIPLEKDLLGRDVDLEGAKRRLGSDQQAGLRQMAKEMGLWGLSVPEELSGAGLGVLAACLVEEEMAKTVIPFNLGDVSPLLFDCNAEQKAKYLEPALSGQKTFLLGLVESWTTELDALETTATRADGSFVINGNKLAFAADENSDFAVVFAVTGREKKVRQGVTCFLVDGDTPGFTVTGGAAVTGWQAQVGRPVRLGFNDCKLPASAILGEEDKAFQLGRKYLPSRRIIRSARCLGAAVRLLDTAATHVKSWQSFGNTIAGWPAILDSLAEMDTEIQAARLLVHRAACQADAGIDVRHSGAAAKVFATEMLEHIAAKAVLVKGGPAPARELPLDILCRGLLSKVLSQRSLQLQKTIIAGDILKQGTIL
jgi:acyl-CoA dehydrogenase